MLRGNATVAFALLVDRQITQACHPVRFKWVPKKSKLVELLPPCLRQRFVSTAMYPFPKSKAVLFMQTRNATVTFSLLVDRQIADAFRPVCLKSVPHKSKLVELLSPSLRQTFLAFALALPTHPTTEVKTIFFMAVRNATVTFALLVSFQIAEAFLPSCFERIPYKPQFVQPFSALLRPPSAFSPALLVYPSSKPKVVFSMIGRDAAMSLALPVSFQIAEAFLPIFFPRIPYKPQFVQPFSALLR